MKKKIILLLRWMMKKITKEQDKLYKAWGDVWRFYLTFYEPENDSDWEVMLDEASKLSRKHKDNWLVSKMLSDVLTYADKRKRGEIDGIS